MQLFLIKIVALSFLTCYTCKYEKGKKVKRCYELLESLSPGKLYHWGTLKEYSSSPGRDLKRLLDEGLLKKVGPGLYMRPNKSRFGVLPATEVELVREFLKTDDFLMFSTSLYNTLNLGLTQLKNETVVYNNKRHETIHLSGREYYFKRPNNSFPAQLTKEFLLLDLMNNLKSIGESKTTLKQRVAYAVSYGDFDTELLLNLVNKYGKVGTKKFFNQLNFDSNDPNRKSDNNYQHKRVA